MWWGSLPQKFTATLHSYPVWYQLTGYAGTLFLMWWGSLPQNPFFNVVGFTPTKPLLSHGGVYTKFNSNHDDDEGFTLGIVQFEIVNSKFIPNITCIN